MDNKGQDKPSYLKKNKVYKDAEVQHMNNTVLELDFFCCDDVSNLLDLTLNEHMEMKGIVEEVYGKGIFYDITGSKFIILFDKKKEVAVIGGVKNLSQMRWGR